MTKIVIVGAGFAGIWSALAAKRYLMERKEDDKVSVAIVAPEPRLVMRPRLYEQDPGSQVHDIQALLQDNSIEYIQGTVDKISPEKQQLRLDNNVQVHYDRLVLAAGSTINMPTQVSGVKEHAFNIDSIEAAVDLDKHLHELVQLPQSEARNTVVVCGGGYTGIELVMELPSRLKAIGLNANIVLADSSSVIGRSFGNNSRSVIEAALRQAGITTRLSGAVSSVEPDAVAFADGACISTFTTIWTVGPRASALTQQIPGRRDNLGRIYAEADLRTIANGKIFAAGDTVHVDTDGNGHIALMSCQHAQILGRFAGYNAAADLCNEVTVPYVQPAYNCCLDLGDEGALLAIGWDREVGRTGPYAKKLKKLINEVFIYPPTDPNEALAQATIEQPSADAYLEMLLGAASRM